MIALGCDIENISRFKKLLRNKEFLSNTFSAREIDYCFKRKNPEIYLAQKFAGKEAVFKAFSSLGQDIPIKLIEIVDEDKKKNTVRIPFKKITKGRYKILVDIANTEDIVLASSVVSLA